MTPHPLKHTNEIKPSSLHFIFLENLSKRADRSGIRSGLARDWALLCASAAYSERAKYAGLRPQRPPHSSKAHRLFLVFSLLERIRQFDGLAY